MDSISLCGPPPYSDLVQILVRLLLSLAETDMDIDVLKYWAAKEKGTEKEKGWPALAKMVKQYFAAPASSAGVERVFSAAGKMHGDLHAPEVREGQHARALAVRGVQHGLSPPVGEWGGSGGAGN